MHKGAWLKSTLPCSLPRERPQGYRELLCRPFQWPGSKLPSTDRLSYRTSLKVTCVISRNVVSSTTCSHDASFRSIDTETLLRIKASLNALQYTPFGEV